ncbi:MAG: YbjN domain-containing protein [Myxococcota bacterium]|nr:YbjN domain-containing protein [Myxococcota bacterium]
MSLTLQSAFALLLTHEGLQPEPINENLIRLSIPTPDGPVRLSVLLNPEAGAAAMYTVHPAKVSAERRVEAAVLIAQFNYGLMAGALELDDEDGELRVRTGVDFGGGPATVQAMSRAMELNLGLREAATPLLTALCG